MNCREFCSALETQHDRREAPSAELREHAAACPDCARLLRADDALRRGLLALRREAGRAVAPAGFARDTRRLARMRAEAGRPSIVPWPLAAGVALAAGVLAVSVISLDARRHPAPAGRNESASAAAPEPAGAMPVVYSNGGVDIVGPQPAATPAPQQKVAVLVEWNL